MPRFDSPPGTMRAMPADTPETTTNSATGWTEPTSREVAQETAQRALFGESPRRSYVLFGLALTVLVVAVMPRVGTGTWLEFTWVIPGMILVSATQAVRRQMAFGRPASRALTAAITVVVLWVLLIGAVAVLSLAIGSSSDRAPLEARWQLVFVALLVVGIFAVYLYARREWPRQDAAMRHQAALERAARIASREPGRMSP